MKVTLEPFVFPAYTKYRAKAGGEGTHEILYKEILSKGNFSYAEGKYSYYRQFRFGSVIAYGDSERVSVKLRDLTGKTKGVLNVKPDSISGMVPGWKGKPKFYRGLPARLAFMTAISKPFFGLDPAKQVISEVESVLCLLVNNILQLWEMNNFPCCDLETKEMTNIDIPFNTVLFPLLKGGQVIPFRSKDKPYKVMRKQNSVKKVATSFMGESSKTATKFVNKLLEAPNAMSLLELCKRKLAGEWDLNNLSQLPLPYFNESVLQNLTTALEHISFQRLVGLSMPSNSSFACDAISMLSRMPEGLTFGKDIKNMTHLHEVLSYINNRLHNDEFKLWCHPDFLKFDETTVEGYKVVFPKTTTDLKQWGTNLGICIGGYALQVHEGYSICFALYKDGKESICVEISGGTFSLVQVYGRNNSEQPVELWEALEKHFSLNTQHGYQSMVDRNREKEAIEGIDNSSATLYKQAIYHTTRSMEWAHIVALHEGHKFCPII